MLRFARSALRPRSVRGVCCLCAFGLAILGAGLSPSAASHDADGSTGQMAAVSACAVLDAGVSAVLGIAATDAGRLGRSFGLEGVPGFDAPSVADDEPDALCQWALDRAAAACPGYRQGTLTCLVMSLLAFLACYV